MPDDAPLIVVCHGLTGGSYESYVRNVLAKVIKPEHEGGLGGRAVVVNVRPQRIYETATSKAMCSYHA
jgi:predicted alpha/beta-fold hydrolase